MKEKFRAPSYLLALSLVASSCSPAEGIKKPKDYSDSSDFPKGTWRYTSGPHDDPGKDEVRYAIDIAPNEVLNCPLPKAREIGFSAIKAGKIHSIESQFGIIRIKDKDGIIWEYQHIKVWDNLKAGKDIEFGSPIGTLGCIAPPGGEITGLHAHIGTYLEGKEGKLIKTSINNRQIGNWTIHSGDTPYNGTLTNKREEIRTADTRDCIPKTQRPIPCGRDEKGRIIRNDIINPYVEYVRP